MSVFQTQYANIDEAWSTPEIAPKIQNPYKDSGIQNQTLHDSPSDIPTDATVKRYLSETYTKGGVGSVTKLLDPAIIRDIQTPVLQRCQSIQEGRQYGKSYWEIPNLTQEEYLYILLAVFALLFVLES
jgi:hypothetical protein